MLKHKRIKYDNHDAFSDKLDNSVALSPIHDPFYGFQENETCQNNNYVCLVIIYFI